MSFCIYSIRCSHPCSQIFRPRYHRIWILSAVGLFIVIAKLKRFIEIVSQVLIQNATIVLASPLRPIFHHLGNNDFAAITKVGFYSTLWQTLNKFGRQTIM